MPVDTRYGIGPLKKSKGLQKLGTLWCYAVVTSLSTLFISASYSYASAIQSTLQAIYSFSALDNGLWYAMYEVGAILSNLFASYFLINKKIPKVLAAGILLCTAAMLSTGILHFFSYYGDKLKNTGEGVTASDIISESLCGLGNYSSFKELVTTTTNATPVSSEDEEIFRVQSRVILAILLVASFVDGVGYAPCYTLGLVYIDNNVADEHMASKYIALVMASYTVGPIMGFGLGGLFLSVYLNLKETYLKPSDEEFLGAWWVGYLLIGGLLIFTFPFMLMFPKSLKQEEQDPDKTDNALEKPSDEQRTDPTEGVQQEKTELRSAKEFLPVLWKLITNPVYILEVIGSCAAVYFFSGWISYLPKYFEEQFDMSASEASIYAGVIPPVIGGVSIIVGGHITSKAKFTVQQHAKLIFFCVFLSTVILFPLLFIGCEQYRAQEIPENSTSCITCDCDPDEFTPICYNGVSYSSPCLAGCTNHTQNGQGNIIYTNCFCVEESTATKGLCTPDSCSAVYVYTTLTVISMAVSLFCTSSAVSVLFRVVPEEDKSFALGIQSVLNSLLGWIPGPILYGSLVDSACIRWEYPNGSPLYPDWKGYCLEYDKGILRTRYISVTFGFMVFSSICCGLAWWRSYAPRYQRKESVKQSDGPGGEDVKLDDLRS